MKVRLIEAATPISKLEYNIKKNILPALSMYNFNFLGMPTKPNMYVYIYNGSNVTYRCPAKLELNTTNREIDIFNDMEDKPYVGDLFATIYLNSQKIDVGVISSKDSRSIEYALDDINFDNYIIKNEPPKDPAETTLIPARDKSAEHTAKEWLEIAKEKKEKLDDTQYKDWYTRVFPEASEFEKVGINLNDLVDNYDDAIEELKGVKANILNKQEEVKTEELAEQKEEEPTPQINTDEVGKKIQELLKNYGVKATYVDATVGPAVTQYEFKLSPGTKISELTGLTKEIAMGLAVKQVAVTPVEGKTTIGIQVPNAQISIVSLDEVLEKSEKKGLSVALGKDLNGNAISADILDMQHVLIGGSTGSGKSASINSMITSLIQSYPPDLVKLVLIDPKKVELKAYEGLPHLAQDIITDPRQADTALKKLCDVMDNRYEVFSKVGVRNIKGYNNLVDSYNKDHPDKKQNYMPYIVVVIDELADLMMTAGKSVESSIQRIAQLARAAGIHLIVATQRPSADVVTGPIKSNIQSRIAFATPSNVDSRVILDQSGAEKLLGKGDMLFKPTGESSPKRLQGAYVSDDQVEEIVNKVKEQYK